MAQKYYFINLDRHQMGELTAFMRDMASARNYRARRRGNAIYDSYKFKTIAEIAAGLQCSTRSVYNWLSRYKKYGVEGLRDKSQPRKLTPAQIDELLKISGRKSSRTGRDWWRTWSLRKMTAWIKDNWQITISPEWLRQIIKKKLREG